LQDCEVFFQPPQPRPRVNISWLASNSDLFTSLQVLDYHLPAFRILS
jgi:hypothetical protein